LLIVLTQHRPSRQTNHNQYASGDREHHSPAPLSILRLKPQKIAVTGAAGGQMIQVRLRLRQWHPVRSNSSDNLATGTSYALWIRELVTKSSTQRS
jgi:hypothetical protein